MRPDIDALVRFEMFSDFRPNELASVARRLDVINLDPGEELFREDEPGDAMFLLQGGKIQIDHASAPGQRETLAEIEPPAVIGEMAILEHKPRSARAGAMRPSLLWRMREESLAELATSGDAAAYKMMRWIARELSDRVRKTNDKLLEIYTKPFKSIMDLKARLKELQPGVVSVGFGSEEDPSGDAGRS